MDFNQYLDQAWSAHATESLKVSQNFQEGFNLLQKESEVSDLAHLVSHVMGQHLGRWQEGINWLHQLKAHPLSKCQDIQMALDRYAAGLELAMEGQLELDRFSLSDKIRIYALATSAVSEQENTDRTRSFFVRALELAQLGLAKDDPANRSLAATGNNLAASLEEKASRSTTENDLMILAAETGRKYWEIAGTWLQVERAEYRLSQTYLKVEDLKKSLEHAQLCIEIAIANSAPALEIFFGYEALGLAEKARGNKIGFDKAVELAKDSFDKLSDSDRRWCEKSWNALVG